MHELVKMPKNRYVTLLQRENGKNFNTKGRIYKKLEYLVYILLHMLETSSNFKLRPAALSIKKLTVLLHQADVNLTCPHDITGF